MPLSLETQAVGCINHIWLTILSVEDGAHAVGLKYISHGWDENPYWLLWFHQRQGVYRLEIRQSYVEYGYDWVADFVLKYYPSQTEPAFEGLSFVERLFRDSEAFDGSPSTTTAGCPCSGVFHDHSVTRFEDLKSHGCGVPRKTVISDIPADFFFAGHFSIAYKSNIGALIIAKSQNYWRVNMVRDVQITGEEGSVIAELHKDSVDRNFPGLEITSFLYGRMISAFQFHFRTVNLVEDRWEGDGILFESDGFSLQPKPSREIRKVLLQAALTTAPGYQLVPPFDNDKDGMSMSCREGGSNIGKER